MDEYNRIVEENKNLPDEQKKKFDISKLGNGIVFHGYDGDNGEVDLSQAFTESSFVFDGQDDYLEFPYDSNNEFDGGFSMEFYGLFHENGRHVNVATNQELPDKDTYAGLINLVRSKALKEENWYDLGYEAVRCGVYNSNGTSADRFCFNFLGADSEWSSLSKVSGVETGWTNPGAPWNQIVNIPIPEGKVIHFVVVFDGENGKEKLFSNGSKVSDVNISKEYWGEYLKNLDKSIKDNREIDKVWFGRGTMSSGRYLHYSHMECYSCKLYSRPLTDNEAMESYKKSVSYHDFLAK